MSINEVMIKLIIDGTKLKKCILSNLIEIFDEMIVKI